MVVRQSEAMLDQRASGTEKSPQLSVDIASRKQPCLRVSGGEFVDFGRPGVRLDFDGCIGAKVIAEKFDSITAQFVFGRFTKFEP